MSDLARELRVANIIDNAKLSPLQIITFALCFCVALYDGYNIGTISSMAPLIAEHFGVSVKGFGPLFAIGFIGMTIGALFIGPTADRVGRKWAVLGSTFVFGLFTLLIAFSPSVNVLIALRFIAGVGLGGALPCTIALTSEYAPRRTRTFIVTLMACGIPLGGVLAPLVGSYIGPAWGWNASFMIGGLLPVCLCPVLAGFLPESLRYMVVSNQPTASSVAILRRIDAACVGPNVAGIRVTLGDEDGHARVAMSELFRHGRLPITMLLWAAFFCTLLTALFIVSWLPAVLSEAGLPVSSALLLASLFSTGGLIGSPILGRLSDRFGPYVVLVIAYLAGAGFAIALGHAEGAAALGTTIFIAGFFIFGAQACIQALAAAVYPTAIRSAGVGWAFGVGRLGSTVGPLLGGMMLAAHLSVASVFLAAGMPALVAAACIALMWLLPRPAAAQTGAVVARNPVRGRA